MSDGKFSHAVDDAITSIVNPHFLGEEHALNTSASIENIGTWSYAALTAAYSSWAGWNAGPIWASNLWCRYTGNDPNHYTAHSLRYFPQDHQKARLLMGVG